MTQVDRLKVCTICEFNVGGDCALCGCNIAQKVEDPNQSCPANPPRWLAFSDTPQGAIPLGAPHPRAGCGTCGNRR